MDLRLFGIPWLVGGITLGAVALGAVAISGPDLSPEERWSLDSSCTRTQIGSDPPFFKYWAGRACKKERLAELELGPPRPDLSFLTSDETKALAYACEREHVSGPATLRRCQIEQLNALASAPPNPDLSQFSEGTQSWLRQICVYATVEGPASLRTCLARRIDEAGLLEDPFRDSSPPDDTPMTSPGEACQAIVPAAVARCPGNPRP